MIYAVNFADDSFRRAQKLNTRTAYKYGADKVYAFKPEDIDEDFSKKNEKILSQKRGAGYWLWKPYFIEKLMKQIEYGDWIAYGDAGVCYMNSIPNYISRLEDEGKTFVLFESTFSERKYTKRDTFVYMGCDSKEYTDTPQRYATMFLLQKNEKNQEIVEEWLKYCLDERILTDRENECGKPNYEDFVDHRHDQSILSILSKKYNLSTDTNLFRSAAYWGFSDALFAYHHMKTGNILHIMLKCYWDFLVARL